MRLAVGCVLFVGCALDRGGLGESFVLEGDAQLTPDTHVSLDSTVEDTAPVDAAVESEPPDTEPADTTPPDTAPPDTAPIDPIYIECEKGALVGGMTLEASAGASNGQWASVPTTAAAWGDPTNPPPVRVELPVTLPAATWYVWVSMFTRAGDADAMYVGFEGGTFRRFYTVDWNKFVWVGAEGGGGGARLSFTPAGGATKLFVGVGDPGTGCDRVALTRDSTWTP